MVQFWVWALPQVSCLVPVPLEGTDAVLLMSRHFPLRAFISQYQPEAVGEGTTTLQSWLS